MTEKAQFSFKKAPKTQSFLPFHSWDLHTFFFQMLRRFRNWNCILWISDGYTCSHYYQMMKQELKGPLIPPSTLKGNRVLSIWSVLPPFCHCDVFGTLLFLAWNTVTLGDNFYFPSVDGNLLLGKEEKFASSRKYFREKKKKESPLHLALFNCHL